MPDVTATTVSTTVLKVPIILEDGSKITYNLSDPKDGLTKDDITDQTKTTGFAGTLVNDQLINKGGYRPEDVGEPYYYNTEKIVFD